MLRMLLGRGLFMAGFKVEKFTPHDYSTMCALINEKVPVYNEAIEVNDDIRLLDEKGKLIGKYSAAEARKKATTLKKDIVLLNPNSSPVICKVFSFRESILKKFYDEIVNKRNQHILKKASSSKQLRLSINLTENEMEIKCKQIAELAKKNHNVQIFSICKESQANEALVRFDFIKSRIQNKCIIEKDIKSDVYINEKKEDLYKKDEDKQQVANKIISMTIKSKDNEFVGLLKESSVEDTDSAIEIFLKRYYKQEDVEMKDLKLKEKAGKSNVSSSFFMGEIFDFSEPQAVKAETGNKGGATGKKGKKQQSKAELQSDQTQVDIRLKMAQKRKEEREQKLKQQQFMRQYSYVQKQARARILNQRLQRILSTQM